MKLKTFLSLAMTFGYLILVNSQIYPKPCPIPNPIPYQIKDMNENNFNLVNQSKSNLPVNENKFNQPRNVIKFENKKLYPKTNM